MLSPKKCLNVACNIRAISPTECSLSAFAFGRKYKKRSQNRFKNAPLRDIGDARFEKGEFCKKEGKTSQSVND